MVNRRRFPHAGLICALAPCIAFQKTARRWKHRLAGIGSFAAFAEAGFLMAYSADVDKLSRKAAEIGVRILKGTKPADIPVEQADRFEFVVNLKTAKALGLTIPRSILLRADRVIE